MMKTIRAMLATLVLATVLVGSTPQPAAAVDAAFSARFSTNAPGAISFTGNTLLTCPPSGACTTAQDGTGTWANNNFSMVSVDVDDVASTSNSSSAELTVPSGGTVLFAGLYWGAVSTAGSRNRVSLDTPATAGYSYSTLTASTLYSTGATYQGFVDITSEVSAAGSGTYTVGGIRTRTGYGRHAGWSIVLVYEDPSEPLRNLTVFDGWNQVRSGEVQDVTLSGFIAPTVGPVDAQIGMIAYEGDNSYTGDFAQLNGINLSDAHAPGTNFFNSKITTGGGPNPGRSPSYADQLGYDAKIIDTSGIVPASASSATISLSSKGDWYYPGVITSAIEILAPNLVLDLTKTVDDVNGGLTHPGDTLAYDIAFTNSDGDAGLGVVVSDLIPAGTTYVPNSMEIVSGNNVGTKTDALDGDQADFDGSTVRFSVGDGATGSTGGRVEPFATTGIEYRLRFKVTVDAGTENTTISNTANIVYQGETIGNTYNGSVDVQRKVDPLADLRLLSKTDGPDPIVAGTGPLTYTLQVGNFGPSPAANVVLTDTLPSGVTYLDGSSDNRCDEVPASSGTIVCNLGTLAAVAPGTTESVIISVDVDETTTTGSIGNSARVSTTTMDVTGSDDGAAEKTTIERSANVSISKSATPVPAVGVDAVAGGQVSYLLTVSNAGPSSATNPNLVDSLPIGTSIVSVTPSGAGTCSQPAGVSCSWPTIASGQSETATVVVAIDPDQAAGTLTNNANANADEDDPTLVDNAVSASVDVVRQVDLNVTKSHTGSAVAGSTLLYTVAVENNGPSSATDVDLVDVLPTGLVFDTAQSSGGCSLTTAPSTVTCDLGLIQPNGTKTVTIGATIPASMADGASVQNSATATAAEGTSNTASDPATVERQVDLSVVKTADLDPAVAGDPLTYTLSVANYGPSNSDGAVITDTLPAGATFLVSGSDTRCSAVGQIVTCGSFNLAAGAQDSFDIRVSTLGLIPGSVLANSAAITAGPGEQDTNGTNDQSSIDTPVERDAVLELIKTDSADPVTAGTQMSWTLTVTNHGPSIDTNVTLTDPLPAGVTFVSATGPCAETAAGSNIVTCNWASLAVTPAAGSMVSTTIIVNVDSSLTAGTTLENTATVDGDASSPVTGDETTTIERSGDLRLTKTAPSDVLTGQTMTYVLTLENSGPSDVSNAVVTDILPPGLTAQSVTVTSGFGSCSGTPLVCVVGTAAADGVIVDGGQVVIEIVTQTDPTYASGTVLTNRAVASSTTPDPDPGTNVVSVDTTATRSADLSITKTAPASSVPAGGVVNYAVVVDNLGPSRATNVAVVDPVPAGLTFNASGSTPGCSFVSPNVECAIGTLDPSDPAVGLTLSFTVSAGFTASSVTNTATVAGTEDDPDSSNDGTEAAVAVYREADLALTKSSPSALAVAGGDYLYTVTVTNDGPSDAVNTVVTDTPASGTSFVAGLSDSRCSADSSGVISCNLGTIASAAPPVTLTIAVAIDHDVTGTITNRAEVASDTTDPVTDDNDDSDTSSVLPRADLQLAKAAVSSPVTAGETAAFTLTVTNQGPSTATSVVVVDELPSGLTFTATGSSPECLASGQTVTCTAPAAMAPSPTPLVFTVAATAATDLYEGQRPRNTAVASSATEEVDPSNNDAEATVTIEREADLVITKAATPTAPVAGQTISYELTVTNNGPSEATGISLADTLPAGLVPTGASGDAVVGCNVSGQSVSCAGSTMATGQTFMVTIAASVDSSITDGTVLINTASIGATEPDPVTANDSASAPVTVGRVSDLSITKSSGAMPVATAGSSHVFELAVRNSGLSDASGVVVTDTLPTNVTFDSNLSSAGCSESTPGTVTCSVGDVPAGATRNLALAVLVGPSWADGAVLTNSATVAGNETEVALDNNVDTVEVPVARAADLAVVKQGPALPVDAGLSVQYTFVVTNNGPSDASGIEVTDTLPNDLAFVAGSPTDSRCTASGQEVTCTEAGPLSPRATTTFTVSTTSSGSIADGAVISNTATVTGAEQDANDANDASTVATEFQRDSDLTVVKVDAEDPRLAGESLSYTVTASNGGPSVAANAVITDTLPAGVSYDDAASDSRCDEVPSPGSGVVQCNIGTLGFGSGDAESMLIKVDVDADLVGGSQLQNSVQLSADSGTATTVTEETTINRLVALSVTNSLLTASPIAGEAVAWEVALANAGPSDASNVVATVVLPAGITNVVVTAPTSTCSRTGAVLVCVRPTLAVGGAETIRISADLESSVTEGSDLTAKAVIAADESELDTSDNAAAVNATVGRSVDVALTKTATTATVAAGSSASWTLTVTNGGPSFASNVVVSDTLPASVVFDPATSSPDCGQSGEAGSPVTCTVAVLADGATMSFTVGVTVPPTVPSGTTLINTASVTTTEANSSTTTTATADIGVAHSADLSIAKTVVGSGLAAGSSGAYRLVVSNAGPSNAVEVTVSDTLPAGMNFDPATSDQRCRVAVGSQDGSQNNTVTCVVDRLDVGTSEPLDLGVTVAPEAQGTITNTARVASDVPDPDSTNDQDSASVDLDREVGLALTKTGPATASVGEVVDWTIAVTNTGPASIIEPITVADELPEGLTFVSLSAPPQVTCEAAGSSVTCTVAALGPAQTLSFSVATMVEQSGQIDNVATASVGPARAHAASVAAAVQVAEEVRSGPLAFTGASTMRLVAAGLTACGVGGGLLVLAWRRRAGLAVGESAT